MRKSSALSVAISLVATFGATAWWQLRSADDKFAPTEQLPAESARPREGQATPGNIVAAQQALPASSSAASPAAAPAAQGKPAATASKPGRARLEKDLEQLRAENEWQLAMGKARNKRIHDAMADTSTPAQLASLDKRLANSLEYIEAAMRYNATLARTK